MTRGGHMARPLARPIATASAAAGRPATGASVPARETTDGPSDRLLSSLPRLTCRLRSRSPS